MNYLKEKRQAWIERVFENHPLTMRNKSLDHNLIEQMVMIQFGLKTGKIFILIVTLSFIFATLFKIVL